MTTPERDWTKIARLLIAAMADVDVPDGVVGAGRETFLRHGVGIDDDGEYYGNMNEAIAATFPAMLNAIRYAGKSRAVDAVAAILREQIGASSAASSPSAASSVGAVIGFCHKCSSSIVRDGDMTWCCIGCGDRWSLAIIGPPITDANIRNDRSGAFYPSNIERRQLDERD